MQTAEALVPLLPRGRENWPKDFLLSACSMPAFWARCASRSLLHGRWVKCSGGPTSLNTNVKDAKWFYCIYIVMLLTSGAVVLIPGAPLVTITMFVQVVAVTLLPAALVFLLLILNEPAFMGEHVNTRTQNIMNWLIVIVVSLMSTLLGVQTLFPDLFK